MNQPIHGNEVNRVLLKPRFKMEYKETKEEIVSKFKSNFEDKECKYCSKMVGNHIVIDIPKEEEHFWSPQLNVELVEQENATVVKGILGPKPKIWTMFMFVHFAVATAFVVFFVWFYVNWSLGKPYNLQMIMLIAMPVIWVILYFLGQFGKKFAYNQMLELDKFLMNTLNKKS